MSSWTPPRPRNDSLLVPAAQTELVRSLELHDEQRALLAAETLWHSTGSVADVHQVLSDRLAAQVEHGPAAVLRLTVLAERLVQRLRPLPKATGRGLVVLAAPPDDLHPLTLQALAHQFEELGYRALPAGGLSWEDLGELVATEPETVAVALSLHRTVSVTSVRRGLVVMRRACGHVRVVAGGPRVAEDPLLPRRIGADHAAASAQDVLSQIESTVSGLTAREQQVLGCIALGMTNIETAHELGLGPATVKSHLDHVFAKTGTTQRAAAVATALRKGWMR